MITARTKVIAFATITGIFVVNNPYKSHNNVPVVNKEYIDKEIPEVSFVLIVCKACGKKDIVVQKAATNPSVVINDVLMAAN